MQPISGLDSLLTEDATAIDTLCSKKEAQKSHLKEQSTEARILIRYKNVPERGTSSRNQPEIGNAALRLKPLRLTIRDFRR